MAAKTYPSRHARSKNSLHRLVAFALACSCCSAWAASDASLANTLLGDYARLAPALQDNAFGQPLVLRSSESATGLTGDIYAVVPHAFTAIQTEMKSADRWCDVMILHINTKYCHAVAGPQGTRLLVNIGKKTPQAVADAARLVFRYNETSTLKNYFAIVLTARDGPLGTSNYRIRLEAVELPGKQSFVHLTYAYSVGFAGRLAMQTYLATVGAGKVGFSRLAPGADGQVHYVSGVRGVVERNTMRYYLAIDAYLASLAVPASQQFEKRLQHWFDATERYPRQLHEIDKTAYLSMKRSEYKRQQTTP